MKNKLRISALILGICMMTAGLPAAVHADSDISFRDVKPDDWFYENVK